jgi:hypothetical protein
MNAGARVTVDGGGEPERFERAALRWLARFAGF